MAIATFDLALSELRSLAPTTARIAALRHLKDQLVGHPQRKELLVQHGLVDALSHTLASSSEIRGKRRRQESNGSADGLSVQSSHIEDEELRMLCIQLVGSLIHGGPAFLAPIAAGSLVTLLSETALSLVDNTPRVVHASLRTLSSYVEAMRQCVDHLDRANASAIFSTAFYNETTVASLVDILARQDDSSIFNDMVSWICKMVQHSCSTESQRLFLVEGGLLDALAARVSSYHLDEDIEWPRQPLSHSTIQAPCPTEALLTKIIGAITVIVGQSRYCVARLLYSPVTISAFPFIKPDPPLQSSFDVSPYSPQSFGNPGDYMLPRVPATHHKVDAQSRAFPALGSVQPKTPLQEFDTVYSAYSTEHVNNPGLESLMVPWLIYTLRAHRGLLRAKAAELLTVIARVGFVSKIRDRMLAVIVAPPLVEGLNFSKPSADAPKLSQRQQAAELEQAAEFANALANLLRDSTPLQKATEEAKAIEKVSLLLQRSFEPIEYAPPTWTPQADDESVSTSLSSTRRLGLQGLDQYELALLSLREAALKLAETLNEKEDRHRKAMCENPIIINCIIDSMEPFKYDEWVSRRSRISRREKIPPAKFGNTDNVLKAACRATMSLARSIAVLRTSMIDSKISEPIFKLLSYPRVEVLIEVLNAIINLLPDWSPLRADLVDDGVIKALCERAHSADSRIRLLSLWALKHLIFAAPNNIKIACFEELGTGWLVNVIEGGDGVATSATATMSAPATTLGAPNAAGERVDLLNADEAMDGADELTSTAPARATRAPPASPQDIPDPVLRLLAPPIDLSQIRANYTNRLKQVKELEEATALKEAQMMELRIQCEAVDFIRNFTQGHKAADMIEYLYTSLDAKRVFDLLLSKIRPSPTTPAPAQTSHPTSFSSLQPAHASTSSPAYTQPPELLSSAMFILVHLAAGSPAHRASLMAYPDLLHAVLPLLSHPQTSVRLPCVWMLSNLTWVEDQGDTPAARARALELRKMGFEARLKRARDDGHESLDVKERIGTAIAQMGELLGPEGEEGEERLGRYARGGLGR